MATASDGQPLVSPEDAALLREALFSAVVSLGGTGDAVALEAAAQALIQLYASPGRAYHTAGHISAVLKRLCEAHGVHNVGELPPCAALAALYHDCVYDTTASAPPALSNEERSARVCNAQLEALSVPAAVREVVGLFIRATETHALPQCTPANHKHALAAFLDADLSILAAEPKLYRQYVAGVRTEYGHLDEESWRAGRAAVLKRLLAREQLYFGQHAQQQGWDAAARCNISDELLGLQ